MGGKREKGRYYTRSNPFTLKPFQRWARDARIGGHTVLEPFAGQNDLVHMLKDTGLCSRFDSYDIHPSDPEVKRMDTLRRFPTGYEVCISNPPWLGRSSARRRGLRYPDIAFDDLYKHCLDLALQHCLHVGFIIPASFFQSGLFRDRLSDVIFLNRTMFDDTENPVCLALFGEKTTQDIRVYYDDELAGTVSSLERHIPDHDNGDLPIKFNDPNGSLGLVGIDNTIGPSIRFCRGRDISHAIKHSSRSITRIGGISRPNLDRLNDRLERFRNMTHDVFLTPFKGLRRDGMYRRRMDYGMARRLVAAYAS